MKYAPLTKSALKTSVVFSAIAIAFIIVLQSAPGLAAEPLRVRFVTFNVDFNNTNNQIKTDVQKAEPKADVMMFQEAKTVTIDNFLNNEWTVFQVVDRGDARRGSAVAVRNSVITQLLDSGLVLGVDAAGYAMLDRYIAWTDLKLTNGRIIRAMSLHMPPGRFDELQPPMAQSLANFVDITPYSVVVGGDWNFKVNNDPLNIEQMTGLTGTGVGIDGFYYDNSIMDVTAKYELAGLGVASDHDPVQIVTMIDPPPPPASVPDWNLY